MTPVLAPAIISLVIALLVVIFLIICRGIVYAKAGEGFWKAFVPLLSEYTMGKISGHPILGLVLAIASIFSFFAGINQSYNTIQARQAYVAQYKQEYIEKNTNYNVPQKPQFSNQYKANQYLNSNLSLAGLTMIINLVTTVISIIIMYGLCNAFDKSIGFLLGLIFFPYIFMPILAFGSSDYRDPARRSYY